MIHRAILGSVERFLGILTEHVAGAFPVWLAPEQVRVVPVADRHLAYAESVVKRLATAGCRVGCESRNEKVGAKIRRAAVEKVPFVLVVGDREVEAETVAVRSRGGVDIGAKSVGEFLSLVKEQIGSKS